MGRRTKSGITVYRPPAPRASAPIIVAAAPARRSGGRRRSGGGRKRRRGGARFHRSGSTKNMVMKVALGGAAFALVEKMGPSFPTIPMLGRAGTVAIAAYFLGGKREGIAKDICLAASTIAAYEMIRDGKIAGEDLSGHDED